jgi:quercetin dioxygenase-like cupin family protein
MIVVSGDPDQTGTEFAIQFRTEGDIEVPPHWHPGDEHVTVLEGVFKLGFGRMFDLAVLQEIPIGSGAHVPAGVWHFTCYSRGAVVQVSGPFRTIYV